MCYSYIYNSLNYIQRSAVVSSIQRTFWWPSWPPFVDPLPSPLRPFIPEKANAKLGNLSTLSKYLWKIFSQPTPGHNFFKNRTIKLREYSFRIKNYFVKNRIGFHLEMERRIPWLRKVQSGIQKHVYLNDTNIKPVYFITINLNIFWYFAKGIRCFRS